MTAEPPPRSALGRAWDLLYRAGVAWNKDNAMRLSAAMAMYTILSLAPLLVITIRVVASVLSEEAATRQVERQTQSFLGPQGAAAVNDMVAAAAKSGSGVLATVLSVGLLLFTASGLFVELRGALNAIWGIDPKYSSGWWSLVRERLLSLGMILAVAFLLLVSQFVTTFLTVFSEYVAGGAGWVAVAIDFVVSLVVLTLAFALLFRFLPDARVGWRFLVPGAAVTAVLFKVGQFLQALYFTYGSTASAYGAAGSFVVVMLWVYYSSWIVFYGAELIRVAAGLQPKPVDPTLYGGRPDAAKQPDPAA